MTIYEILTFLEIKDEDIREELEMEANVIRLAVNSAMSGKPLKLFEEKPTSNRRSLEEREEELKALEELGL